MSKQECWTIGKSKSGRIYFTNIETGISQWGMSVFPDYPYPIGWEYHFSSTTGDKYYRNAAKGITKWDEPQIENKPPLIEGWITLKSRNCNQTYYQNIANRKTQWDCPIDKKYQKATDSVDFLEKKKEEDDYISKKDSIFADILEKREINRKEQVKRDAALSFLLSKEQNDKEEAAFFAEQKRKMDELVKKAKENIDRSF